MRMSAAKRTVAMHAAAIVCGGIAGALIGDSERPHGAGHRRRRFPGGDGVIDDPRDGERSEGATCPLTLVRTDAPEASRHGLAHRRRRAVQHDY